MIRIIVAAVLIVGLADCAFAQATVPGAPAGTAPETPAAGRLPSGPGDDPR